MKFTSLFCTVAIIIFFHARDTNGQSHIFGQKDKIPFALSGTIYALPENTRALPLSFDTCQIIGKLFTYSLNVAARQFTEGFPGISDRFEWFAIDYHGMFYVAKSGRYNFLLESDDGSKLYIDSTLIIDNDGEHGTEYKLGGIDLEAGIHSMNVQYFQGPRYEIALRLFAKYNKGKYSVFDFREYQPGEISTNISQSGLSIDIAGSVLFDFDDARLKSGVSAILDDIYSNYLQDDPDMGLVVKGFTDDWGSVEYNRQLSYNRAMSVRAYFTETYSDSVPVWALGMGEADPKFPNTTDENRQKNRRVELLIIDAGKAEQYWRRQKEQ